MNTYISQTQYAVKNLIDIAWREDRDLELLKGRLAKVEAKFKAARWDFETSDMHEDFSDAYVMNAFRRMADAKRAHKKIEEEKHRLEASIGSKQSAVQAICGAILQISKQGISAVHGKKSDAPKGRAIGTVNLRDIIWEARNQALHYEEGRVNPQAKELFEALVKDQGSEFCLDKHNKKSRAKQIIQLLGWQTYENYCEDMKSLL